MTRIRVVRPPSILTARIICGILPHITNHCDSPPFHRWNSVNGVAGRLEQSCRRRGTLARPAFAVDGLAVQLERLHA